MWDQLTDEMRVFCSMPEMKTSSSFPSEQGGDGHIAVSSVPLKYRWAQHRIKIMFGRSRNGQGRDLETDGHRAMAWEVVSGPLWFEQWAAN